MHFKARGLLILDEITSALNQDVEGGKDPEHAEQLDYCSCLAYTWREILVEGLDLNIQPKHTFNLERGVFVNPRRMQIQTKVLERL